MKYATLRIPAPESCNGCPIFEASANDDCEALWWQDSDLVLDANTRVVRKYTKNRAPFCPLIIEDYAEG